MYYIINTELHDTIKDGLMAAAAGMRAASKGLLESPVVAEAHRRADAYENAAELLDAQPTSDMIMVPRDVCVLVVEHWAPKPLGPIANTIKRSLAGEIVAWPR